MADPLQCMNDLIVIEQEPQTVDRYLTLPWARSGVAEDAARFLQCRDDCFLIVHGRELRCSNAAHVAHDESLNRDTAVWFRAVRFRQVLSFR